MNKFWESARIALDAIWTAKLRSFMTVLGNIVAVTSIIAVVSLIQGLNASVKQAILNQAGADSFNIQQFPITRSDEEFEKVRGNPRITLQDAKSIRRYSDLATAVMLDAGSAGRIVYRDKSIDSTRVQGITGEYVNFSSLDAERGRLMSPTEVDTSRPVCVLGWQTADTLFGSTVDPLEKTIQIEGHHFRVVGVSAKRGAFLGQSQDEFAVIPLGQFQMLFGSRRTREIGLRKALGARRSDIMSQILTESVVLSVFGGVVGTIIGASIALTISAVTPIPASVEPWSVALGIGITAAVGLFFGLYPAMRAARLDPIEALRRE